jgi:hypothetical protein
MIASHTDEFVDALSELRVLFPDWRMGQLIANLVTAAGCSPLLAGSSRGIVGVWSRLQNKT